LELIGFLTLIIIGIKNFLFNRISISSTYSTIWQDRPSYLNKGENADRFALREIKGELLERERGGEKEIVLGYYTQVTYYP
jgi:hypothetical protein